MEQKGGMVSEKEWCFHANQSTNFILIEMGNDDEEFEKFDASLSHQRYFSAKLRTHFPYEL